MGEPRVSLLLPPSLRFGAASALPGATYLSPLRGFEMACGWFGNKEINTELCAEEDKGKFFCAEFLSLDRAGLTGVRLHVHTSKLFHSLSESPSENQKVNPRDLSI